MYLNESWQLTAGWRLRYLPDVKGSQDVAIGYRWDWKVKQDLIHAAEVGLMYQF